MPDPPRVDLIIIGAPRSGTNMLRDTLCRLPGFATWPCDEINYVWRHGNARWPSDLLPPSRASDRVTRYIRRSFARRRQVTGCEVLVEKTCANSLRVPFIRQILPRARFLFIHRDPVDAVASAVKRWSAPLDLPYTLAKARYVPVSDLPYYGLRFVRNRLHRLFSSQRRLAFWGPHLDGMDELLGNHTVTEVCALQWRECVSRSAEAFRRMSEETVHVVRYEDFVASPSAQLRAICDFLDRSPEQSQVEDAVGGVTDQSVGKGRRELAATEALAVEAIVGPAQEAFRRLRRVRGR